MTSHHHHATHAQTQQRTVTSQRHHISQHHQPLVLFCPSHLSLHPPSAPPPPHTTVYPVMGDDSDSWMVDADALNGIINSAMPLVNPPTSSYPTTPALHHPSGEEEKQPLHRRPPHPHPPIGHPPSSTQWWSPCPPLSLPKAISAQGEHPASSSSASSASSQASGSGSAAQSKCSLDAAPMRRAPQWPPAASTSPSSPL